jgi:hypothetical protein
MANGIITYEFDIKALHYLNSNSRFIRATADANGNIDIAAAALQYYNMTNTHFDMELESEDDVNRFKHVARRFFSSFSEN